MQDRCIENEYLQMKHEDGIIHIYFKPGTVINLEIAEKIVKERLKISQGEWMPIFIDVKDLLSIDAEARKYMAGKEAVHLLTAGAFRINSLFWMFMGNLFIKIDRPLIPTRLFTNKEKALDWLEYFKPQWNDQRFKKSV